MTPEELMIAKLRYLLYEAIVELNYLQQYEHGWPREMVASAKGEEIIERGMELLEVKDLGAEHIGVKR